MKVRITLLFLFLLTILHVDAQEVAGFHVPVIAGVLVAQHPFP